MPVAEFIDGRQTALELATKHIESIDKDLFIKGNPMDHSKTLSRSQHGVGGSDEVQAVVSFHLDVDAGEKNSKSTLVRPVLLLHSSYAAFSYYSGVVTCGGAMQEMASRWLVSSL